MILAVDIGNSNIVLGGYQNGTIRFVTRIATDHRLEADQYAAQFCSIFDLYHLQDQEFTQIILSSVVPGLTQTICRALSHISAAQPVQLSLLHAGNIQILIENPAELGMDILAAAIAVRATRSLPAVIIDMGTATKLSALDGSGRLVGVAITPGLYVSLSALVQRTNTLSNISIEAPKAAIGRNTAESMKSGVVLGTASMLDGMIDRFGDELGKIESVVATGGASSVVVPHCRHTIEVSDTLLLDGLYQAVVGTPPAPNK